MVERAGYGFSDTADTPRDIDTVLEETREALTLAGESGPYILFPHSLSGIEAIYWGQKYPSEVKGIIGLDAAVPSLYLSWGEETLNKSAESMAKISVLYQAGMIRLHPELYDTDPAMTGDILSDEEKAAYKAECRKSGFPGKAGSNSGTLLYIRRFSGCRGMEGHRHILYCIICRITI